MLSLSGYLNDELTLNTIYRVTISKHIYTCMGGVPTFFKGGNFEI